jgi:hypothetical protein
MFPVIRFLGPPRQLGPLVALVVIILHSCPVGCAANPAVNTDARRRGFARAAVAGYLTS